MAAGMPAGGALASLASAFLLQGSDWRLIFAIGGALPLLIAPVAFLVLPETLPRTEKGPNSLAAALFGGGRATSTVLLLPLAAMTQLVLSLMLGWLPLLVGAKGLPKADGASAALAFNVAGVVGAIVLGGWVDRGGTRWPMLVTYAAMFGAMFALSRAGVTWEVVSLAAVAGFTVVGANLCLYGLAPHYYTPADRAAGAGAAVAAGRVGSVTGPLLAGALREAHASAGQVLAATLPVIAAAAMALLALTIFGRRADTD
jgi:AAHS family 3-hydroxyphenylpropionic acid transporter